MLPGDNGACPCPCPCPCPDRSEEAETIGRRAIPIPPLERSCISGLEPAPLPPPPLPCPPEDRRPNSLDRRVGFCFTDELSSPPLDGGWTWIKGGEAAGGPLAPFSTALPVSSSSPSRCVGSGVPGRVLALLPTRLNVPEALEAHRSSVGMMEASKPRSSSSEWGWVNACRLGSRSSLK